MNGTGSPLSSQNRCVLLCTGTCHRCPVFCTRKLKWKAMQFWNHRRKTECSSHTVRVHPCAHRNTDLIEVGRFIGGSVAVGRGFWSLSQYALFSHPEIETECCAVLEPSSQNRLFFAFGPRTPLGPSEHEPDRGRTLYWWICSSRREATPPQRLVLPDT